MVAKQSEPCSLTGEPHDPRTEAGALMAPARFPHEVLEKRKIELGPYAYDAQYQQRPTPRAGMVLNPVWFVQRPRGLQRQMLDVVQVWDLNYSDSERADYTIGMTAAVDRGPVLPAIHILDIFEGHFAEQRHEEVIFEQMKLWRPLLCGIERRAFEKQGATMDLVRRLELVMAAEGLGTWLEPVEADRDKVTRAMIIPGRAKAGLITVDLNAPWWPALSREMRRFPKSEHDDRIDTLAHLVRMVAEKLAKVRSQQMMLGKSADLEIVESHGAGDGPKLDYQRAAIEGYR
jgi:predicted phage terminase large subunit-like protein